MVAAHTPGISGGHQTHHPPQHTRGVRATVDEIADEDQFAAVRVGVADPAETLQQRIEFGAATVNVTDEVERTVHIADVAEQPRAGDPGGIDRLDTVEDVHESEPLLTEIPSMLFEQFVLPHNNSRVDSGAVFRTALQLGERHVKNDGHREDVVLLSQIQQPLPILRPQRGGIDDRQQTATQTLRGDIVQRVERVDGRVLLGRVVGHHRPERVRRQHLSVPEMPARGRRFTRPGYPDQHDETQPRYLVGRHELSPISIRVNTAVWVGGPTSGSSSPMPPNSTAYR